jgi:ubiquinone/menaquinone biosynthesis C-methylase UbiE
MANTAGQIPERFKWATALLEIKPSGNILEIGCGAGIFAEQIAGYLTTGKLVAIDRSAPMISKAKKRNQKFIEQGITSFAQSDFLKADLPAGGFDKIVAFNVNFFWKNPAKELLKIKPLLKPGGRLYVFYQLPYEINSEAATPIRQKLLENSFKIIGVHFQQLIPASAFCIIAQIKK